MTGCEKVETLAERIDREVADWAQLYGIEKAARILGLEVETVKQVCGARQ